jgi:hypothetical protein
VVNGEWLHLHLQSVCRTGKPGHVMRIAGFAGGGLQRWYTGSVAWRPIELWCDAVDNHGCEQACHMHCNDQNEHDME